MFTSFFHQPTWPVAVATLIGTFGTLFLQHLLYRRTRRMDEQLRAHSAEIGERNAKVAALGAELKELELGNNKAAKWAEMVERRTDRLHSDFAELIGLLQVYASRAVESDGEMRGRIAQVAASVSLALPPSGRFNEEVTIQLGHVREAMATGPTYLAEHEGLLWSLQNNAWKLLDAERQRVLDAIITGETTERAQLSPHR